MVTRVPTGDRRGWDTVDSTQTLTGALVTAPKATGVLSTRTGRVPEGAIVTVPEALTPAGGAAPAGSVRPAGIPRWISGSCDTAVPGTEARVGLTSGSRLQSSSGSTASLGRGAGAATQKSVTGAGWTPRPARPAPHSGPFGPRPQRHLLGRSPLPQQRSHVRRLSPAPQHRVPQQQSPEGVTSAPTIQQSSAPQFPRQKLQNYKPERPKAPYTHAAWPHRAATPAMFI